MKSLLKAFSAVALAGAMALPVQAGDTTAPTPTPKDQKDIKKVLEDQGINYVETAQKGIVLSGYVDTSYTYQFAGKGEYGPAGYTAGTPNQHAALRQFDTSNNTFNINAVKIALEKALPDKNEWAAGFRIDTIYGEDAKYLGDTAINGTPGSGPAYNTATNNSGLALEQAFVKFRVPVGNGLDFQFGKFVTLLGYEVIESPANLNFSRGLLFTNAIPLTTTGIMAAYKFNDTVDVHFGIVDGWNNSTTNTTKLGSGIGFPQKGDGTSSDFGGFGKALTGQVNINAPGKNANITQSFIYSPEGEPGVVGQDNGPLVVYDIWGNWSPTFVKDSALLLGFNIDLGYNGASGVPVSPVNGFGNVSQGAYHDSNTWWGIALYSQYKFNKTFSLAGRAEYLHSDSAYNPKFGSQESDPNISLFSSQWTPLSQDDFSYTLTASFNIWENLLTRVEYRLDDLSGSSISGSGVVQHGNNTINHEISLNAVYSF